jgi:chemotaxis protein CheC
MLELTELQRDALGELFNIGVGRAASSLSQIVRDEVELSAPVIALVRPEDLSHTLLGSEFTELSMVTLDFTGPFDAKTMLVFPERNALAIIGSMLDEGMSPEELSEFEQEAMCEVGNIILNACISALADLFEVEFHGSLPVHHFGDSHTIAGFSRCAEDVLLLLQIDLVISQKRIEGRFLFLLSVSSLHNLMEHVDRFLARQGML